MMPIRVGLGADGAEVVVVIIAVGVPVQYRIRCLPRMRCCSLRHSDLGQGSTGKAAPQ